MTSGSSFSLPRRQLRWYQDPALLSHLSLASQSHDCTSWWYEYRLLHRAFRNHNTWDRVSPAGNHGHPSAAGKCVTDNCVDLTTLPSPQDSTSIWANAGCIYLLWKWLGKTRVKSSVIYPVVMKWTGCSWSWSLSPLALRGPGCSYLATPSCVLLQNLMWILSPSLLGPGDSAEPDCSAKGLPPASLLPLTVLLF